MTLTPAPTGRPEEMVLDANGFPIAAFYSNFDDVEEYLVEITSSSSTRQTGLVAGALYALTAFQDESGTNDNFIIHWRPGAALVNAVQTDPVLMAANRTAANAGGEELYVRLYSGQTALAFVVDDDGSPANIDLKVHIRRLF